MIKKILLLSNVYPAPDLPKGYTPVVHYFAREWIKIGYQVKVINYDINFPSFYYKLSRSINSVISSHLGCEVKMSAVGDLDYTMDLVDISRIAITKFVPHSLCSKRELQKAYEKSLLCLQKENFQPDVIIGHWANPCLQIMAMMKSELKIKTCLITHGADELDVYGSRANKLLESIDVVGCRSEYIRKKFNEKYGDAVPTFTCYSGIPEKYVDTSIKKDFSEIRNFIYVGTLISRKFPSSIIPALAKSYKDEYFSLYYVGVGDEIKKIKDVANEFDVSEKVFLHGRLQRDKVVEMLDKSDVFIMISKNEAFGLVYLEAMARGCITIASRKEGFDGIIQDGVNGFLCEAGNSEELLFIIDKIRAMDKEQLQTISNNAINTAFRLTDVKAATMYISSVERLMKINSQKRILI